MKWISSLFCGSCIAIAFFIVNPSVNAENWEWWLAFIIIFVAVRIEEYYWDKEI